VTARLPERAHDAAPKESLPSSRSSCTPNETLQEGRPSRSPITPPTHSTLSSWNIDQGPAMTRKKDCASAAAHRFHSLTSWRGRIRIMPRLLSSGLAASCIHHTIGAVEHAWPMRAARRQAAALIVLRPGCREENRWPPQTRRETAAVALLAANHRGPWPMFLEEVECVGPA